MGKKKGLFGKIVGGIFAAGILKDLHKSQVDIAIKKAKKRNAPNKAVKQMNKIRQDAVDLEKFLKEIP